MTSEVVVGVLSLVGTLIGTIAGIMTSSKLTIYRIDRLEEKVNKHNNLIERTYKIEQDIAVIQTEIKEISNDGK